MINGLPAQKYLGGGGALGKLWKVSDRGGGLVVSVLDFCSEDPSSILADCQVFFSFIVPREDEISEEEAWKGPSLKKRWKFDVDKETSRLNEVMSLAHCCYLTNEGSCKEMTNSHLVN